MNVELVIIMRKIDKHFFRHSMPVPVDLSERTLSVLLAGTIENALVKSSDFDAALKWINRLIDSSPVRAAIRAHVSVASAAVAALDRRDACWVNYPA